MSATGVRVVGFAPEYASAFRDLNLAWLERYFEVEPVDREILGNPQDTIISAGGDILFALLGEDVVGTVALKHHGEGVFELTKMAVSPTHQGLGIGRRLLDATLQRYADSGGRHLYLESHSSLEPALLLYESAGFEHAERPAPSEYRRADVYMVYRPD